MNSISLKARFALMISGLVAFAITGLAGTLYISERNHLLKASEDNRSSMAERLSRTCRESMAARQPSAMNNSLKEMMRVSDVLWAMVMDSKGKVVAHSNRLEIGRVLSDPVTAKMLEVPLNSRHVYLSGDNFVLEYAVPFEIDGQTSIARLAFDWGAIYGRVRSALGETIGRFVLLSILALFLSIIAAAYVADSLLKPIQALTEKAQQIGAGNFHVRMPHYRSDELGQLSKKFNWMAANLEVFDKMKDDFVAIVSHDLRSPLSAITMNAEYLLTKIKTEPERKLVSIIQSSTERLAMMVNNILDAAKMKAGRMEYHKEPISPIKLIDEAWKLFEMQAGERGISIIIHLPPDTPNINADENAVHRVFSNLISNAIKFTRKGGRITVGAKTIRDAPYLEFYVSDTGIGISPEDVPSLFQKFSALAKMSPQDKKNRGAGLGLMIAKNIVEDHGGAMWLESTEGLGTTFYWTLPTAL